jgi:hypothetical protein
MNPEPVNISWWCEVTSGVSSSLNNKGDDDWWTGVISYIPCDTMSHAILVDGGFTDSVIVYIQEIPTRQKILPQGLEDNVQNHTLHLPTHQTHHQGLIPGTTQPIPQSLGDKSSVSTRYETSSSNWVCVQETTNVSSDTTLMTHDSRTSHQPQVWLGCPTQPIIPQVTLSTLHRGWTTVYMCLQYSRVTPRTLSFGKTSTTYAYRPRVIVLRSKISLTGCSSSYHHFQHLLGDKLRFTLYRANMTMSPHILRLLSVITSGRKHSCDKRRSMTRLTGPPWTSLTTTHPLTPWWFCYNRIKKDESQVTSGEKIKRKL